MRICKLLIFFLFLFDWSGRVEGQSAFNWPQDLRLCAGQTFRTATLSWEPEDFLTNLVFHGWYTADGNNSLVSRDTIISLTVGDFLENDSITTLIFRSSIGSTFFYDVLRIVVVQRPEIEVENTAEEVCYGEEFTLTVSSSRNADTIIWTDISTGETFSNNATLTITEPRIFSVLATNDVCVGDYAFSREVRIDTVLPDTTPMDLRGMFRTICQDCRDTLSNLLELVDADTLMIESSTWRRDGISIGSLFWDSHIYGPATGDTSVYEGLITGFLYRRSTNICRPRIDTLTNKPVRLTVSSAGCLFRARWVNDRAIDKTLRDTACITHTIEIENQRRDIFAIQNPAGMVISRFSTTFLGPLTIGDRILYRFNIEPEDNDTIIISITYRNSCTEEYSTFLDTLFFITNERIILDQDYCRTDSLDLVFRSNRRVEHLILDSVVVLRSAVVPNYTRLGAPESMFRLNWASPGRRTYTFKDTVHRWNPRNNFRAVVHYTYCGVAKTDTTVLVRPELDTLCLPRIFVPFPACMGDTNFIYITETRRPTPGGRTRAYIDTIIWIEHPDIKFIGDLDTVFYHPSSSLAQFRQKFVTYTRDPIHYILRYIERELDTTIDTREREASYRAARQNFPLTACSPEMILSSTTLCRGEQTRLTIRMRNLTGHIQDTSWMVTNGEREIIFDSDSIAPSGHRIYRFWARFQKTSQFNARITYNFGSRDSVVIFSRPITVDDCKARIWQEDSIRKTYCDGEIARFEIRPDSNSASEILRVVWDPVPLSPMIYDSTGIDSVWHFHTNVFRDAAVLRDTTIFVARVLERDHWGDEFYYALSDTIFVVPFPRIWRQRIIDVCMDSTIDLTVRDGDVQKHWNCDLVREPRWSLYPFRNSDANAQLFGREGYTFRVEAEARELCVSMGGNNIILDSFYLRRNRMPSVSAGLFTTGGIPLLFPTNSICVNDTLYLEVVADMLFSTVTWLRGTDTIFRDRRVGETLRDVVTESIEWYKVINSTACGAVVDTIHINVIPAPPLTLFGDTAVCLYDTAQLHILPDPRIVGILQSQWHVYDTMFVGEYLNLQIRSRDTTRVTVLVRGYNDCNAKGTIRITSRPLPDVRVSAGGGPGDTVSCVPVRNSFQLQATGDPGLLFRWDSAGHVIGNNSPTLIVDSAVTATTFRVRGTNPTTGCRSYANYHIVIFEQDKNLVAANFRDTACERDLIHQFSAEYIPYVTHIWRTALGRDIPSRTLTINNVELTDTVFRLFRSVGMCRDTSRLVVKVQPTARLETDIRPNYCMGDDVKISVEPQSGVVSVWWEDSHGAITPGYDLFIHNIDESNAGDFSLSGIINIGTRQCTTTNMVSVVVKPLPIVGFREGEFLCIGGDPFVLGDTLTMTVGRPNASFEWCTGETTPTIRVSEGGTYHVTITDTETKCFTTASVIIEGRPSPIFQLPNDTAICFGESMRIEVGIDIETGIDNVDFFWTLNSDTIWQLNFIEIVDPGVYKLTTKLNACSWSESIEITNRFCDVFEMSSAFRPGSGIEVNRIFKPARPVPEHLGVVFEMFIYDSWGRLVFRTRDPSIGWDGTDMSGREVRPGVFVWVIRAHETLYGTDLSSHGTVTLIK